MKYSKKMAADPDPYRPTLRGVRLLEGKRIWLEARNYSEASTLAREWREPLVVQLTPENYRDFLPEHRRWQPRRLIWRLPPVIRESALSFYHQAMTTLAQGDYRRFLVADWGGLALVRQIGGEAFGDQTLGVRNSRALAVARELGAARVCLPPRSGPKEWQEWLGREPRERFWGYLYQVPALAIWPGEATPVLRPGMGAAGEKLQWVTEGEMAALCPGVPEHLGLPEKWLHEAGVAPLIVGLPRSGLPWGRVPAWLARPEGRHRPRR